MPNAWLVIWCDPEREERARQIRQILQWTRGENAEALRLGSSVLAWALGIPLCSGMLADIVGPLHQEPECSWALAVVSEPSQILLDILPKLRGQVVLDQRIAGDDIDLYWDHPLGRDLHEKHLGLWSRGQRRREEPSDPSETLRKMRNVPRSPNDRLESQHVAVRLQPGVSPAQYAGIAYSDVPDGSEEYNGVGGQNVLLFHSAMECGQPPFEPHGADRSDYGKKRLRPTDPDVFVFLNAPAVGVRHFSVDPVPNSLVGHVLARRISVERAIAEPEDHVRH